LCERGVEEKDGQFYWQHDRRLVSISPLQLTEDQILSCLQAINAKSCLILATEGFAFNEQIMSNRIKAVSQLMVDYIEGRHHLHMEKPDACAKRLVKFYEGL
jgi:hypothetical protein